jgi:hypothetical protein
MLMKSIHNLIGKAHKAIDIKNGLPQITVQQFDGR